MKAKSIDAWPLMVIKRKALLQKIIKAAQKNDYSTIIQCADRLSKAHALVEKAFMEIY